MSTTQTEGQPRRLRTVILVCTVYWVLHTASEILAQRVRIGPQVSLREAPGLALALLLVFGTGYWPIVFVAYLSSSLFVNQIHHEIWIETVLPLIHASCFAVTAWLIRRRFGPAPLPKNRRESGLLILAAFAATVPWVIAGSWILERSQAAAPGAFLTGAFFRWLSGTSSILTILPIALVVGARWLQAQEWLIPRSLRSGDRWEVAAQLAALALSLFVIEALSPDHAFRGYALCFIPLAWIALTRGLPGAAVAVLVTNVGGFLVARAVQSPESATFDYLLFSLAYAMVGLGLGGSVTIRNRAEAERGRLQEIIEAAPDFIATLDLEGKVLYANPALLRLRGLPDGAAAKGVPLADFRAEEARRRWTGEALPEALAQGSWMGESSFLDVAGNETPVSERLLLQRDGAGRPAYYALIARDVFAQKKAEFARLESERQLLHAQKLESLGVLSGGIAHDFNNLLTVMLGNASLAAMDLPPGSPTTEYLERIRTAVARAAELCKQLLAYSGKGQFSLALIDFNGLVDETVHLLRVSINPRCELKVALAPGLPPVQADAGQMRQIVMNLAMNASDAIGDRGGMIHVTTGICRLAATDEVDVILSPGEPGLKPGDYVTLEVTDDGTGMTPEIQRRIFEPFFTTKFAGRGLGLAAVLGIVRAHRGALSVESERGRGSRFRLYLPAAHGRADKRFATDDLAGGNHEPRTVLVVDDEEAVREVAARLLQSQGFVTVLAHDGRQAVDILADSSREFHAVLLDLTMPGMNGEETFRELRKLRPNLPVLLMSGFNERESTVGFGVNDLAGFIPKPFDAKTLTAKLRGVLG